MKNKNNKTIQHPLFGISVINWIKLLKNNGGVDIQYINRALFITFSSIFTTPARILFKLKYKKKIMKTNISHAPIFIIGHWRSGTTYLHEILSQDSQFCYISLWNALLPDSFLVLEPFKNFLSRFLPSERPMDSIKVTIDGPYEEEAGIAVLFPWSFFHCMHFARNAEEQFLKSIYFKQLSNEEKNQWEKNYLNFMKSITYANNGKQLLLKNPANTARIKTLLELFPNAKFIHIYRNPYKVYLSTVKMRKRVLDKLALQNAQENEIEGQVIENYKRLMKSFFEQKKQIPEGNLINIKYEDLVSDPIYQVTEIYKKLKIPGLKKVLPEMQKYIDQNKDYKTNIYIIDKDIIKRVNNNWKFTIDLWKYNQLN